MGSTIRADATQHWAGKAPSLSKGKWLKRALGAARNRDRSIRWHFCLCSGGSQAQTPALAQKTAAGYGPR
ncbi:MAG: hypothetical protein P8Q92_04080, partial [Pseudoprimorskyibacter sp.]|nr:hypothetical protein [Pseudoprimorskyibacter sp.]